MKPNRWIMGPGNLLFLLSLVILGPLGAAGQEPAEGINSGNYNIKQAIELGYRATDITGNTAVYRTFENLGEGPRLFEHNLQMRSLDHAGALFDDLYLSSFGYGGDPETITRLRMYKNKWYNFNGTFRRFRNLWDYNLLANPLNPPGSNPTVPITTGLHQFSLTRRMSDFNLTLLPQSRVRFRLGYNRNINEGPSLSTFHEGTDVVLFQDWKTTVNAYSLGVDYKPTVRTNISYDQFLYYYKGDTSWVDQNFGFQLADGTPVDLGIIFNTAASQPCAAPVTNAVTTPPTANPRCNGYLAYSRSSPMRTNYPTEQLSFQTSEIKNLDLSGRLSYSSSESSVPVYEEFYQGLVTRTSQRQFEIQGPAETSRISVTGDLAATYWIKNNLRIVDTFRFNHFRIPGQWAMTEASLFGTSMLLPAVVFDPATCPPPYTAATCPPHGTSSPADNASEVFSLFLGQNTKFNTVEIQYDATKKVGGRLGYRYQKRNITQRLFEAADLQYFPSRANRGSCVGQPLLADGSCEVSTEDEHSEAIEINEHSLLFGIWTRPIDGLKIGFDLEAMSADNVFTRISPRNLQIYKLRAKYSPARWINVGGSVNIYEARNNVTDINNLQHSRTYGFNLTVAPNDRWSLDTGYDFNDVFSQTNICFAFSGAPAPPGTAPCPIVGASGLGALSEYNAKTDFAYTNVMFKPVNRVTVDLGYSMSAVDGSTLIINPNSVPGPLQYTFHKPFGSLAIALVKGWEWKTGWGFYNYREQLYFNDLTGPRSFRGNLVTFSVRHTF